MLFRTSKVMSNDMPINAWIMLLLGQGITNKIFTYDRNAAMKKRTADNQLDRRPVSEKEEQMGYKKETDAIEALLHRFRYAYSTQTEIRPAPKRPVAWV